MTDYRERQEAIRRTWSELEPELDEQGYELVDVEFARRGSSEILRLFIDKEGGVTIDDCAKASRYVSALLDKGGFVESRYMLEVSSPGIERPVRKETDFRRFAGERIKLKTITPVDGRRQFKGTLTGIDDGLVVFEDEGREFRIHLANVHKANLDR